uniref:Uncharacterized protein n=1 Tax=Panagrolaimus superbus TaxID=310955 RepID=A0A914Z9N3_9BILA
MIERDQNLNCDASTNDTQYDNLNLNQTDKSFVDNLCNLPKNDGEFSSKEKKFNDNSREGYYSISYLSGESWYSNEQDSLKKIKTAQSHIFECQKYKTDRDCSSCDSCASSTLSLRIAGYEAAIELVYSSDNFSSNRADEVKSRLKKKLIKKAANNDAFEIPRQQKEQPKTPEIMQFKANQKVINPNEKSPSITILNPSPTVPNHLRKRRKQNDTEDENDILPTTPPPNFTPLIDGVKQRFIAPALPKLMTPQELENFEYNEPELRNWQRTYLNTQEQEPHKETLEEEIIRLKNKMAHYRKKMQL